MPASRSNERERRIEIYDEIVRSDIPRLRVLHEQIETSKDLIDEDTTRERRAQKKKERINLGLGIVGVLLATLGVVLTILALYKVSPGAIKTRIPQMG